MSIGDLSESITLINGTIWHFGSGAPASTLGNISDAYLDLDTQDIYQKDIDEVWNLQGNLGAGIFKGAHDASSGLPAGAGVKAGNFWLITVAGTIAGIGGNDNLEVGDFLYALVDTPSLPADFSSIQANLDPADFATAAQGALADTAMQPGANDTDDLPEGATNLYYTETRVSNNADVAANTLARKPTTKHYVGPGAQFTTIQAAIDFAELSPTLAHVIEIASGSYIEDLTISQGDISLVGARPGLSFGVFLNGGIVVNHADVNGNTFESMAVLGIGKIAFDIQAMGANGFLGIRDCFSISTGQACVKTNSANVQLRIDHCFFQCTGAGGATLDMVNYNQLFIDSGTVVQCVSNTGLRIAKASGTFRASGSTFLGRGVAASIKMLDLQNSSGGTVIGSTFSGPGIGIEMTGTGSTFVEDCEVFLTTANPTGWFCNGTGNLFTGDNKQLSTNYDINVAGGIVHSVLNTTPVIV